MINKSIKYCYTANRLQGIKMLLCYHFRYEKFYKLAQKPRLRLRRLPADWPPPLN